MKNFLSTKKKAKLLAAIIGGTTILAANTAAAMEEVNIGWEGKNLFRVQYYNTADKDLALNYLNSDDSTVNWLTWNLSDDLKGGLNKAFYWWAEIIEPGANIVKPAQVFVVSSELQFNAYAAPLSLKYGKSFFNPNLYKAIFTDAQEVAQFENLNAVPYTLDNDDNFITDIENIGYSFINIGQNMGINEGDGDFGWEVTEYYALPVAQSMRHLDITPVMFHEIGHTLGLLANVLPLSFTEGETVIPFGIFKSEFDENHFTAHLYNQNGEAFPRTLPTYIFGSQSDYDFMINSEFYKGEMAGANIYFVDNIEARTGRGGKVYLYFVGDNVTEVLDGKTFTRGDGQQVSGIPINLWENRPEFSHIELARSMMSHQHYRSYNGFIEAELAVMQDIGYDIDRKNFFGRSIYNDGLTLTNTQGFSARANGQYVDGYNNSTLGVGLHVYGSNNNITQAANIYTNGAGAVGIRVDGLNDKITVAEGTEVHADGVLGTGVLIAYGKNHEVNINGTVTANGAGGDALHFEFGANSLGSTTEYRGSYIRYIREVSGGKISSAYNFDLKQIRRQNDDYSITDLENGDLNAPMVDNVNISGKLESESGSAIYIAEESFVKNININEGAQITGDIDSVWKVFDAEAYGIFSEETLLDSGNIAEPLKLQYNGGNYVYNEYIPDLVTNLNFNADNTYNGDISGSENIKMNVTAGTLNFGGTADVVNVNVANGAKLLGGTFYLNDMTEKLADGFSDDTTGKFYNHGTISNVEINGDLVSDGTLSDEAGKITVNGAANVEGSTIVSKNVLPDESAEVLTATEITGNISNPVNNPAQVSGLLSGYGEISGNSINYKTVISNNIGGLNEEQTAAFAAVKNMSTALRNDDRKSQLLPIYYFDSADAGQALSQVGNSDAAQFMTAAQQSTFANRVISDRLSTAFKSNSVSFNAGGLNFADGDENILMGVSANYDEPADNNFWVKFTKNWGELKGGANYHGQAISGGYDRALGENWRAGLFVSYNATSLSTNNSGGNAYDTRFGIYGGYHNDVDEGFIYIDAGKVRNKLNRSISALGLGAEAKYNSNIFEIGGEYKRNLTPEKSFAVSPFINLQYSHLKQHAYNETGAGIFNQHVKSKSNGYFAGQLGVEYKRVLSHGNYAARIGVKHAFTGAAPELNFSYEGDNNNFYTLKNNQDKTHFILSISGENYFKGGWILGGDIGFQKGGHDKDLTASVMLRKVW